jgi:hypothetical protein
MDSVEARYYPVHFDDVSAAVNYCGALVPHLVDRLRTRQSEPGESPAIWFHARTDDDGKSAGCDLLMTPSAILAAVSGQLRAPRIDSASRTSLPAGAVLVLGEDARQAPLPPSRRRMLSLHATPRLSQRSA